MSHRWSRELATAIQAVCEAMAVCRRIQGNLAGSALEKDDRSPVTIADFASQALICRALKAAFPEDAIVAEEDSTQLQQPDQQAFLDQIQQELALSGWSTKTGDICEVIDHGNASGRESRYWTLDPIDGTKGFLRGEQYAISLALVVDGQLQVAALGCPNYGWKGNFGTVFSAARAQGAFVRSTDTPATPEPVSVSPATATKSMRFCESVESGHSRHDWSARIAEQLEIEAAPLRLDSQAKYGAVGCGHAEAYLRLPTRPGYHEKIWDHAGGVLVVEEAGGRVTDIDGKPLDFSQGKELMLNRGVVVSNAAVHPALLDAIRVTSED